MNRRRPARKVPKPPIRRISAMLFQLVMKRLEDGNSEKAREYALVGYRINSDGRARLAANLSHKLQLEHLKPLNALITDMAKSKGSLTVAEVQSECADRGPDFEFDRRTIRKVLATRVLLKPALKGRKPSK